MRHACRSTLLASLSITLAASCAHAPWPDEPGVAVELVRADNLEVGDLFYATLTDRRRAAGLSDPIVTPRYQSEIRAVAEDLQAGKTSSVAADRAVRSWATAAFGPEIVTFTIDCKEVSAKHLPSVLLEMPSAVISYAGAHFRPKSLQNVQCAILAVALTGSESVERTKLF